jgi:hypothetical protein
MLAVISSCLSPSTRPGHDGGRTNISAENRLAQTIGSVASLVRLGFTEIYLADNSAEPPTPEIVAQLSPARVTHFAHYPYKNKSIAEAFLLLALLPQLPKTRPVMKLSGRYQASMNLCEKLGSADLAGLFSKSGRVENLSTRAYAVRDADFFARMLQGTLDELYATPWRVVGPRSALTLMRRILMPRRDNYPYSDPLCSLEISAARWLSRQRVQVRRLDKIGVQGVIGSWINPAVNE